MTAALPPSYVNTPVPIAYAEVDDALIVTMIRILGLCWAYDYERTPALTPEQVAELTGRARSTLYRHLKELREMQWIRVDQAGRRIIIRPIMARKYRAGGEGGDEHDGTGRRIGHTTKRFCRRLPTLGSRIPSEPNLPAWTSTLSGCAPGSYGPSIPTARA